MADDQLLQESLKRSAILATETEPVLGVPDVDGQVLASDTAGNRAWVTVALDPVFSNPESVIVGAPVPLASVDSVFTNPETRLP
jgi:hypothetical protein